MCDYVISVCTSFISYGCGEKVVSSFLNVFFLVFCKLNTFGFQTVVWMNPSHLSIVKALPL